MRISLFWKWAWPVFTWTKIKGSPEALLQENFSKNNTLDRLYNTVENTLLCVIFFLFRDVCNIVLLPKTRCHTVLPGLNHCCMNITYITLLYTVIHSLNHHNEFYCNNTYFIIHELLVIPETRCYVLPRIRIMKVVFNIYFTGITIVWTDQINYKSRFIFFINSLQVQVCRKVCDQHFEPVGAAVTHLVWVSYMDVWCACVRTCVHACDYVCIVCGHYLCRFVCVCVCHNVRHFTWGVCTLYIPKPENTAHGCPDKVSEQILKCLDILKYG